MLTTRTALRPLPLRLLPCLIPILCAPCSSWAFQLVRPSACRVGSDVACSRDALAVTNYKLENYGSDDDPIRWFQADQGQPIPFYISKGGDADLGEPATIALVQQAMDAWNNVPGSRLRIVYAGTADPTPVDDCSNPQNIIVFNDPYDEVADRHAAGITQPCSGRAASAVTTNGRAFMPIQRAGIVVGKSLGIVPPPYPNTNELAVTLTHELGHAIGLAHSSEDPNESDPNLRSAVMYGDGANPELAASITPDDINGLLELYGHGETVPYWTCVAEPFIVQYFYCEGHRCVIGVDGLLKNQAGSLFYQCTRDAHLVLPIPHPALRYAGKGVTKKAVEPTGSGDLDFRVTHWKHANPFQVAIVLDLTDGTTRTIKPSKFLASE